MERQGTVLCLEEIPGNLVRNEELLDFVPAE